MITEMKNLANNGHFVFQQNGARSHPANSTIKLLQNKVPELLQPKDWPPNSPDLNPIDYGIWENLLERVYQHKIKDIQHLKNLIIEKWSQMPQEQINRAIDQFCECLKKLFKSQVNILSSSGGSSLRANGARPHHFFHESGIIIYT